MRSIHLAEGVGDKMIWSLPLRMGLRGTLTHFYSGKMGTTIDRGGGVYGDKSPSISLKIHFDLYKSKSGIYHD